MIIDPLTMDDGSSGFAKRRSPGAITHMSVPGAWHMLEEVMLKMRSGLEPSPQSTQVAVMLAVGSWAVKFNQIVRPGLLGFGERLVPAMIGVWAIKWDGDGRTSDPVCEPSSPSGATSKSPSIANEIIWNNRGIEALTRDLGALVEMSLAVIEGIRKGSERTQGNVSNEEKRKERVGGSNRSRLV